MQKARRPPLNSVRPLVDTQFQDLFHSLIQGSFHLSFTVLVRYRSLRSIQPYQMVLTDSDRIPRVPPYSGYCQHYISYMYRTFTSFGWLFQNHSISKYFCILQPYNPGYAETKPVQAVPFSLATTKGITIVLFSCGYLDVSVPHVRLPINWNNLINQVGLPHSGVCGSIHIC